MIKIDEDALICDLAEYYGIYDYRQLPVHTVAVLACGLREGARIIQKLSERRFTLSEIMDAVMIDRLNWLCWSKTKDASKGWNRPSSLAERMLKKPEVHRAKGFGSADEFMKWRSRFVEG